MDSSRSTFNEGVWSRPGDDPSRLSALLRGMKRGDRQAAADFVTEYGDRVQRRIRGKMNAAMRRIFDSQEILSTFGRRLDSFVASGQLAAVDESELWNLVMTMATRAVIDKSRLYQRLTKVESADGELAARLRQRVDDQASSEMEVEEQIALVLNHLDDPIDRDILLGWLNDDSHASTARMLDLEPEMVRKRWQRIRESLIYVLSGGSSPSLERLSECPSRITSDNDHTSRN